MQETSYEETVDWEFPSGCQALIVPGSTRLLAQSEEGRAVYPASAPDMRKLLEADGLAIEYLTEEREFATQHEAVLVLLATIVIAPIVQGFLGNMLTDYLTERHEGGRLSIRLGRMRDDGLVDFVEIEGHTDEVVAAMKSFLDD